jgi:hypothetical protein
LEPGDLLLVPGDPAANAVLGYYQPSLHNRAFLVRDRGALASALAGNESRTVWLLTAVWHDRVDRATQVAAVSEGRIASTEATFIGLRVQKFSPSRADDPG